MNFHTYFFGTFVLCALFQYENVMYSEDIGTNIFHNYNYISHYPQKLLIFKEINIHSGCV